MFELIEAICDINQIQWNNSRGSYDNTKSAAMIIEEALESIGAATPRETSREIVANHSISPDEVTEVDCLDSLLDDMYIVIGELHKLGLTPSQIVEGLQVVHDCNLSKSGTKDSTGKVTKPTDGSWNGPEPKLQVILNNRPK
jgi:predicted HAD superfamily Cof-like phosphohydrolase